MVKVSKEHIEAASKVWSESFIPAADSNEPAANSNEPATDSNEPAKKRKKLEHIADSTFVGYGDFILSTAPTTALNLTAAPSPTAPKFEKNADQIDSPDIDGVDKSITEICANLSHQIYSVKEKDQFKMKEDTDKVVIFDNHGELDIANPAFVVAVTGKTLIMGWRGSNSTLDFISDASFAPVTAPELGEAKSGIRGHGVMFSFISSDLAMHQTEIVKHIKNKNNPLERIVFTGHSLAGSLANVAHLFVQAQINEGSSVWCDLEHLTLKTVAFAALMSTIDQDEVGCENETAKKLMKDVGKNTYNIIFGLDFAPRLYSYTDYLYNLLKETIPNTIENHGGFWVKIASGPISAYALDFIRARLQELMPIMVKYRHLGTLLYYEDKDARVPLKLRDTGPPEDNVFGDKDELKHYSLKKYGIKNNSDYAQTLREAHSHFPAALASYTISKS